MMKHLVFLFIIGSLSLPLAGQTSSGTYSALRPDSIRTDSASKASAQEPDRNKIKIVKRKINSREYIILAIGMMAFIALILSTVQSWNPSGRAP